MWCFNDEKLARLIAASKIPVISAVGHEIDFTICDFVSDLRAPTPSAAAELVAKSSAEIVQKLIQLDRSLAFSMKKRMDMMKQSVLHLSKRLTDPKKKLQDLMLRSDDLFNRLENAVAVHINGLKKDVQILQNRLVSPKQVISSLKLNLDKKNIRLNNSMNSNIQDNKSRLQNMMSLLDSLSPMKVVDRGFSITKTHGKLLKSISQVKAKDVIEVQVNDGVIEAEVIKLNKLKS